VVENIGGVWFFVVFKTDIFEGDIAGKGVD